METHSPLGVPSTQLRMWSHALLAALSALLAFLACEPGGSLSNLVMPPCHMFSWVTTAGPAACRAPAAEPGRSPQSLGTASAWLFDASLADAVWQLPAGGLTLMMAAPRCCTVVMNSPLSHSSLLTTLRIGSPPTVPWLTSGYCVEEWLPQMMAFFTSVTGFPVFSEICMHG